MTAATPIRFGLQVLLLGDGDPSDEMFAAPCGLTQITKTTNVQADTTDIPDCDDPDAVSWLGIDERSRQIVLSFTGLLAQEAIETWREWDYNGGNKNVRYFTNLAAGVLTPVAYKGGHFTGAALLTAFEEQGQRGQKWQISGTITFDGKPTWTSAL